MARVQQGFNYFFGGVDSYSAPDALTESEAIMAENVVFSGGLPQTRPGSQHMHCLPIGRVQGSCFFTPTRGTAQHVVAVDGKIYVSAQPYTAWRLLPGLSFAPTARFISFHTAKQSSDYRDSGELYWLDEAVDVLIIQDGLSRAGYWDGADARHLNPTKSLDDTTEPGLDETPIGLWMQWSNDRLWVAKDGIVYASDIGNPLKFTESHYLNEARSFFLPGDCTGMVETPDQSGIIVFTANAGIYFKTAIRDRTAWLSTVDFQKTLFSGFGCVAPRSIVVQYGLIWWFSQKGLTNLNAALRANVTSRFDYQDLEMSASKRNIGLDMAGIVCTTWENFLLVSVPSGDVYNNHTWVLGPAVFEGNSNVWHGYWTGWRPVSWSKGIVDGQERLFFVSRDYDDQNRTWEMFTPDRKDNGCDITCWVQFPERYISGATMKRFQNAIIQLRELYGSASFSAFVAGQRGTWSRILTKELRATAGQVYSDQRYGSTTRFAANRPQTRLLTTAEPTADSECGSCGVESNIPNIYDRAFSLLCIWEGRLGISAIVLYASEEPDYNGATCEDDEDGVRGLNEFGCASTEYNNTSRPLHRYAQLSSFSIGAYSITTEGISYVSQAAAERHAECRAIHLVNKAIAGEIGPGDYVPPTPEPEPEPDLTEYLVDIDGERLSDIDLVDLSEVELT